jgi:hypothetical protein
VPLRRLEEAWTALHQYRARKYNWQRAAEDWRRSLQDLEGGFLTFNYGVASFVNPSVKDFLDTTLTSDTEHLDDLLSTTCFFDQIVSIWSLAESEKGSQIQKRFQQSPEQLMTAANQNLQKPHQQRIEVGEGVYETAQLDSRPELRLETMVSIADQTKSETALDSIVGYTQSVITFWSDSVPDFEAATNILRAFDRAKWQRVTDLKLHELLKGAILTKLGERQRSGEIFALVDYADSNDARWTDKDQQDLVRSFENYLEDEFDEEIADRDSNPGDLQSFSDTLESVANWCQIDVDVYLDQISERINELTSPEEEDDRPVRRWEESSQPMSQIAQEQEVMRLFDGL